MLIVRNTRKKGRGVFTDKPLAANVLVESCPVIVVSAEEPLAHPLLSHVFRWGPYSAAIALGYGSIYNHSWKPNVRNEKNYAKMTVDFYALHSIKAGAELCHDYNYNAASADGELLWMSLPWAQLYLSKHEKDFAWYFDARKVTKKKSKR